MKVVFVTCGTGDEAVRLLRALLEERLVACGNIVPGVRSLYWWQGSIQDEQEVILFMETPDEHVAALIPRIQALHAYETPKILTLPVEELNDDYHSWLREVTGL